MSWLSKRTVIEAPAETAEERPSLVPTAPVPERPRKRWWLAAAASAVALALVVWALVARRSPSPSELNGTATLRTATVERRDFVRTLRIHGTVEAVDSFTISAPRLAGQGLNTLVVTRLATAGSAVKRGDLLVEFDRQQQQKNALDRRAEYLDFEEQIKKKRAEQEAADARDETEIVQAENAVATAQLEIRKNEIVSRIDAEKNQQNLEEARARLAQLRETLELKLAARRAELRILEIQRDRAGNAMRHAERNAERMAIRSPIDGLVVLNTIWKGGQMGEVQEGDEIRPGVPFLQVVNPNAMQVRARVNQADVPALRLGQPVEVRLDAYSDLVLPGRVGTAAAIGNAGQFSRVVRTFNCTFSIQGSDPRLLPDLSAAVDVEIERRPNVLVAPRDSVHWENGQAYVEVKNGSGFERRAVKVAAVGDHEVAIESGVEPGAVVRRGTLLAGVF